VGFTYWSSIDSDSSWGRAGWATPEPKGLVSDRWHSVCWEPQIQSIEQNESFKRNAKWVYTVQRRAWSGMICEWWVPDCRNQPLNRTGVLCQIWDHCTRQESGSEVYLNIIPERGNTRLYSLEKPGIRELCLGIRYLNSISRRKSFYPRMIGDILCWICLRGVEMLIAILLCNWLWIIQHGWFSEYPEFFHNSSFQCAWHWEKTNNLNHTWRFKCTG